MSTLAIAFALTIACVLLSAALPRPLRRLLRPVDRLLSLSGRSPRASIVLTVCVVFGTLWLTSAGSLPTPAVHDEFAYLLTGDTFAHGRLTNPTHPHWEHFETFHVIHQPSYQGKYPPGQGVFLALGQVVFGHPAYGVMLSLALAAGAMVWMLQGWMNPRWAVVGGLLFGLGKPVLSWWGLSYWGGAVAALGGALVYGAIPRLVREPRLATSGALGTGLVLLSMTRPYEGLLASVPAMLWLVVQLFRSERPWVGRALKALAPAAGLVMLGLAWQAQYNAAVTGNPLRMPYHVWWSTYTNVGQGHVMVKLDERPTRLPKRIMSRTGPLGPGSQNPDVVASDLPFHGGNRIPFLARTKLKLLRNWAFFVGPLLTLALVAIPFGLNDGRTRFLATVATALLVAVLLESGTGFPHYLAPVAGVFVLLLVRGLRQLQLWRVRGRPCGAVLARLVVLAVVVQGLVGAYRFHSNPVAPGHEWSVGRARLVDFLNEQPGRHLVFARYGPDHRFHEEWVYNAADIDGSKIVWAHDLGPERNAKLLEYFGDRTAWIVEADVKPNRPVRPYRLPEPGDAADPPTTTEADSVARTPAGRPGTPVAEGDGSG